MRITLADDRDLPLDRPRIMGVLNVTPDSFSDGGHYLDTQAAIRHGLDMLDAGADLIDIGGESTRPGSEPVPPAQQLERTLPVIRGLVEAARARGSEVVLSIDTTWAQVAEAALDAGASMINDVSAGLRDPALCQLAAARQVPIILMHMQGTPATMQQQPTYDDVVTEVRGFLLERAAAAVHAGVDPGAIILDPGIGFGKTTQHNLQLLAGLEQFVGTGYPILLGTSRKRFLGEVCARWRGGGAGDLPAPQRDIATAATTALGVAAGVMLFRVHDVPKNRQAADTAWAIRQAAHGSLSCFNPLA